MLRTGEGAAAAAILSRFGASGIRGGWYDGYLLVMSFRNVWKSLGAVLVIGPGRRRQGQLRPSREGDLLAILLRTRFAFLGFVVGRQSLDFSNKLLDTLDVLGTADGGQDALPEQQQEL